MSEKLVKERLWSKDYLLIMTASACISSGNYFFMSTLPIFAERLTGSTALSGLVTGVYTFSALCSRPVTGVLADRVGRIKVAIVGAVLAFFSILLYNVASVFALLVLFRIIHGLGFGIHSTAALTAASDVVPSSRRMEGIGYLGLFTTLTAAVGPALALTLVLNVDNGFTILFLIGAGFAAFAFICDLFIDYEKKLHKSRVTQKLEMKISTGSGTFLGFEKSCLKLSLILFVFAFSSSSISTYIALYAKSREFGNVGLFFTFYACAMAATRLFAGRIGDKYGAKVLIIPAMLLASISYLLIPLSDSRLFLILLGFPYGLAQGTIIPTMNVMIINKAPVELRGSANGTYYAAMDTGIGLGAMFWGVAAEVLGYNSIYHISAVLPLVALFLFLYYKQ